MARQINAQKRNDLRLIRTRAKRWPADEFLGAVIKTIRTGAAEIAIGGKHYTFSIDPDFDPVPPLWGVDLEQWDWFHFDVMHRLESEPGSYYSKASGIGFYYEISNVESPA